MSIILDSLIYANHTDSNPVLAQGLAWIPPIASHKTTMEGLTGIPGLEGPELGVAHTRAPGVFAGTPFETVYQSELYMPVCEEG